jgi:hypothetical protein
MEGHHIGCLGADTPPIRDGEDLQESWQDGLVFPVGRWTGRWRRTVRQSMSASPPAPASMLTRRESGRCWCRHRRCRPRCWPNVSAGRVPPHCFGTRSVPSGPSIYRLIRWTVWSMNQARQCSATCGFRTSRCRLATGRKASHRYAGGASERVPQQRPAATGLLRAGLLE